MYLNFCWTVLLVAKTVASPEPESQMLGIQYIIASIRLRQKSLLNFIHFSLHTQVVYCVLARSTERHITQHEHTSLPVYTFYQRLSVCLSVCQLSSFLSSWSAPNAAVPVRWQKAAYELQPAISERAGARRQAKRYTGWPIASGSVLKLQPAIGFSHIRPVEPNISERTF